MEQLIPGVQVIIFVTFLPAMRKGITATKREGSGTVAKYDILCIPQFCARTPCGDQGVGVANFGPIVSHITTIDVWYYVS